MFTNLKNSAAKTVNLTSNKKAIASVALIVVANVAIIVAGHYIGEYIEKNL